MNLSGAADRNFDGNGPGFEDFELGLVTLSEGFETALYHCLLLLAERVEDHIQRTINVPT